MFVNMVQVAELLALLQKAPPDAFVCPNAVGNLAIYRLPDDSESFGELLGWIDFREVVLHLGDDAISLDSLTPTPR